MNLKAAIFLSLALAAPAAAQTVQKGASPSRQGAAAAAAPAPIPASSASTAPAAVPLSSGPAAAPAFARLAEDYWAGEMRRSPLWATYVGFPGYDDQLDDIGPGGRARELSELGQIESRLVAIDSASLGGDDRVSWEIMKLQIDETRERQALKLWQFDVDPMDGPQVWIPAVIQTAQPMKTASDARNLLNRLRSLPLYYVQQTINLREGLEAGRLPARIAVQKTIDQLERQLELPAGRTPYAAATDRLPEELKARWSKEIASTVEGVVKPALADYKRFLENELLPRARPDEEPGLAYVEGGDEAYRFLIKSHTTLGLAPEEIHRAGLEELRSLSGELEAVRKKLRGRRPMSAFLAAVKADRRNFYSSGGEIVKAAEGVLARLKAALPAFFGVLPKTELVVKPVEAYREKEEAAAQYFPPPDDLSRPGIYYVNTWRPETRARFETASMAAHEGLPGHHLQMALALERRGLPAFRRNAEFTAFVEGWALYSERLADEMGLYAAPLDRLGMLSGQAFRACRLVVDTGLHADGWSRRKAIDFLKANTALGEEEAATEVDRYIALPGQALAYKIGQREIEALRREEAARLGPKFDLKAFHDAVLRNGAVPLPVLRRLVRER